MEKRKLKKPRTINGPDLNSLINLSYLKFLSWRSLLNFLIGAKTIFDDISTYSALDFMQDKTYMLYTCNQRRKGMEICNASAILEISGKLKLLMNI